MMSKALKKVVFICKSVSDECHHEQDPYIIDLENRGFSVKLIIVLDFVYKNINGLRSKLLQPDKYSGETYFRPKFYRPLSLFY